MSFQDKIFKCLDLEGFLAGILRQNFGKIIIFINKFPIK